MWMIFARAPRPDARHWPGRRVLAVFDAVVWPAAVALIVLQSQVETGVVGQTVLTACGLAAARRAWRASLVNHRYRFTTTSVAGVVVPLIVAAILMKASG